MVTDLPPGFLMHRKSDNCIKIQSMSPFLPYLQGIVMKHLTRPLVDLATLMVVVLMFLAEALDRHLPGRRRQPWRKREIT